MFNKFSYLILVSILFTSCSSEYKNINECKSLGTLKLICGLQNPEDFAKIPHSNSLVVSQFAGLPELNEGRVLVGKLSKLNMETQEIKDYEVQFLNNNTLGIGDQTCEPYEEFYPHGIDIYEDLKIRGNNLSPFLEEASLLAVVNHQKISSIEFFLIFPDFVNFSNQDKPTLFWVGCTKAPEANTFFNDVVISDKSGSFYATHQYDKDLGFYRLFLLNIFKLNTGHVYKWSFKDGYSIIPNSQGTWPNGIDMIDDDLYVNYRGNGKITKFSANTTKDLILRTYLNGGPDNVTAVGNELWIGGQNTDLGGLNCIPEDVIQCPMPFFIVRADRDLNILEEYNFQDVAYGGASVAYPFEDKIFIGAYKSDRIAIFKR